MIQPPLAPADEYDLIITELDCTLETKLCVCHRFLSWMYLDGMPLNVILYSGLYRISITYPFMDSYAVGTGSIQPTISSYDQISSLYDFTDTVYTWMIPTSYDKTMQLFLLIPLAKLASIHIILRKGVNMADITSKLLNIGLHLPDIIIPKPGVSLEKWAVIACDQYTSEPEYWEDVERFVGDSPSTLRMIFPECYLELGDRKERIKGINDTIDSYLSLDIFTSYPSSFFLIKRGTARSKGGGRWGLIAAVDLDAYDYTRGSEALIRATEGTILDRIPPRKQIRRHALLESPHIMVLIDDPGKTVIEPLAAACESFEKVYDFDLMKGSGHITGYRVSDERTLERIADALAELCSPDSIEAAYGIRTRLLFAIGDGNHSLATAKSCWEDMKTGLSEQDRLTHPSRFALVEIENIYDPELQFEPIHRVMFGCDDTILDTLLRDHCESFQRISYSDQDSLMEAVEEVTSDGTQHFGYVDRHEDSKRYLLYRVSGADSVIAAGTIQGIIDDLTKGDSGVMIDYIHGLQNTVDLGCKQGNCGILLPSIEKSDFFHTVIKDGSLPRKTFSMGEADEKRFYLECRRIQ